MADAMAGQLAGKNAFVTGAGRGIGRGIALVLASRGANVAVCDINEQAAGEVAEEIKSLGRKSTWGRVDVTDSRSVNRFADQAIAEFGGLDICVPNAGVIGAPGFAERRDYSDADWNDTWGVNVKGLVNTVDAVKPHMRERQAGKIVNIASHGGRKPRGVGDPGRGNVQAPYLVSKAAVIQFTHILAIELGSFNINVNAVCPGRLWTPMWEAIAINHKAMNPALADKDPYEIFLEECKKVMPLGRPQTPEDIGKTVAFLASEDAAQITGQAINVNSGAIMN